MKAHLLLIEDDESLRDVLAINLEDFGFGVDQAADGPQALAMFDPQRHDLVLTDLHLPGMQGLEVLERLHAIDPQAVVLVLTAFGGAGRALEAVQRGAFHYVEKPVNTRALVHELERALAHRRGTRKDGVTTSQSMVASSPAMNAVLRVVDRVANSMAPVMILGESGVGKELVAHAIHERSERARAPFIAVNCAAIPPELLESTLFGYEKGAFTGAHKRTDGKFIAADGGTLFLDEIAEMSASLQSKLLRVLQDGLVERVGSVEPEQVNVRIVTATHQDLKAKMEDGTFRQDLYYRLHVVPVNVPPLRERREDIPVLMRHFLRQHGIDFEIDESVDRAFLSYRWPGNIRELRNVVERMVLLHDREGKLGESDIPTELHLDAATHHDDFSFPLPDEGLDLQQFETHLIMKVMNHVGGNQSAAARYLNIPRHVLVYRLDKFGIDPNDYT